MLSFWDGYKNPAVPIDFPQTFLHFTETGGTPNANDTGVRCGGGAANAWWKIKVEPRSDPYGISHIPYENGRK